MIDDSDEEWWRVSPTMSLSSSFLHFFHHKLKSSSSFPSKIRAWKKTAFSESSLFFSPLFAAVSGSSDISATFNVVERVVMKWCQRKATPQEPPLTSQEADFLNFLVSRKINALSVTAAERCWPMVAHTQVSS